MASVPGSEATPNSLHKGLRTVAGAEVVSSRNGSDTVQLAVGQLESEQIDETRLRHVRIALGCTMSSPTQVADLLQVWVVEHARRPIPQPAKRASVGERLRSRCAHRDALTS